jgi:hypothetical protein
VTEDGSVRMRTSSAAVYSIAAAADTKLDRVCVHGAYHETGLCSVQTGCSLTTSAATPAMDTEFSLACAGRALQLQARRRSCIRPGPVRCHFCSGRMARHQERGLRH